MSKLLTIYFECATMVQRINNKKDMGSLNLKNLNLKKYELNRFKRSQIDYFLKITI